MLIKIKIWIIFLRVGTLWLKANRYLVGKTRRYLNLTSSKTGNWNFINRNELRLNDGIFKVDRTRFIWIYRGRYEQAQSKMLSFIKRISRHWVGR